MLDTEAIKAQFPVFSQKTPQGESLIYLDNAATTQKPQSVIDAVTGYYAGYTSNVGRGSYWPATKATQTFNQSREKVRQFINAASLKEVIFTSGTTDAINKLALKWLLPNLNAGDAVICTEMEHHGNFVPWQQACSEAGAELRVIPISDEGDLDMEAFKAMLGPKVKLVAVTAVSNALGTRNDLEGIIEAAHGTGAKVLIDAAQMVTHEVIDVQALDCDFLCFSAHKLFGPTGLGVLYGKQALLEAIPPMAYGGGMVKDVSIERTTFAELPAKHEGGTSHIAGVIGLGAAIDFVNEIGLANIKTHTSELTTYALSALAGIEGIQVIGSPDHRASVISLAVGQVHPHDVASFLAEKGIAIRAGHHCTHPLMKRLGLTGTCRVSFGIYNTKAEIDLLIDALIEVRDFFA